MNSTVTLIIAGVGLYLMWQHGFFSQSSSPTGPTSPNQPPNATPGSGGTPNPQQPPQQPPATSAPFPGGLTPLPSATPNPTPSNSCLPGISAERAHLIGCTPVPLTGGGNYATTTNQTLAQIYSAMQQQYGSQQYDPDSWGILFGRVTGLEPPAGILVMGNNANPPISLDTWWAKLVPYAKFTWSLSGLGSVPVGWA